MRIAQVMLARGFGGAERSFVDLCRALAARGHQVLAVGDARGIALPMLDGTPGITTARLRCHGNWDLLARLRLRSLLRDFQPVVVQAHLARAALHAGAAAHAQGIPTVAKTHNMVDARYYRDIDLLVPTTRAQAEHLAAQGVAASDICRIPNFSALGCVDAVPSREGPPWILKAVGRLVEKKGYAALLDAFAELIANGVDARLVIGGDGPEAAALRARAQTLGVEGRVTWAGWVENVAGFLDDAHMFVLSSHDEPFGIVLLEAMARGVPIVTTPTAGPLEILGADSALFTRRDDAPSLATALGAALADYDASRARAAAALRQFRDHYSASVVVARYLEVYTALRGRKPRRREA